MKPGIRGNGFFVKMLPVLMVLGLNVTLAQDTWIKTFGGRGRDRAFSVQETSEGDYIIAGCTEDYSEGDYDIWLIKTDGDGEMLWDKTFGGSGWDKAYSVQETSDSGYIIGGSTSSYSEDDDFWLIKTDVDGNKIWDKRFGGSDEDYIKSVQETSDGGYIVTGETYFYSDDGDSGLIDGDLRLIKTDGDGEKVWDKTFGGSEIEENFSVQETSDGGYIVAGSTLSYGAGESDVWLIKTDGDGEKVWDKTFGGSGEDKANSVQVTSEGGYIVAGWTVSHGADTGDVWLIKTDGDGEKVWDKTFGGGGVGFAFSVQETSDSGYIVGGGFIDSSEENDCDVWLIKTDGDGEKVWDKTFGGSDRDFAFSVQQTSDDGYIVVGETYFSDTDESNVLLIRTDGEGSRITSDPSGFGNSRKQDFAFNAFPDPAHSGYHIQLSPALKSKINGNQDVSLRIYSTQGRMVQEINGESLLDRNSDSFYWDGIDSKGNKLNAGYYLLTVSVGSKALATSKIVLAR